nr:hypothetical protein [uncultured Sphaerochaeta sp.]
MQESIMLFFLNIENPVLDFLGNLASLLGEQTFVIAVILYIFWNHDKKKGFGLYSSVLLSVLAMGILKATVKAPRPFQCIGIDPRETTGDRNRILFPQRTYDNRGGFLYSHGAHFP